MINDAPDFLGYIPHSRLDPLFGPARVYDTLQKARCYAEYDIVDGKKVYEPIYCVYACEAVQ